MDTIDTVVIGGGVVGLAVARALAVRGFETLILEALASFGTQTSSRNSEVIHAGIYYPRGSLKARLCVEGRESLYAFCDQYGIEYRRCGKLIVAASESQLPELHRLHSSGRINGAPLTLLDRREALNLEPSLSCVAALHSPTTGIIDTHAYMLSLLGQAQNRGALLACDSRVTNLRPDGDAVLISVNGKEPAVRARSVINSAGLHATQVASTMQEFPRSWIPTPRFAKGTYFSLAGPSPFRHLVYPVPEHAGLGVHLTLDLAGRARFGPDVEWVDEPNYEVDPGRAARFYPSIRSYWPALPDGALQPGYAGIRPKIAGPGEPPADFRIEGPATHGVRGVVNLFGIESPGLTASLALAEYVANLVCEGNA